MRDARWSLRAWLRGRGWVSSWWIRDGGVLPRWMGIAYVDVVNLRALILPVPLNVPVMLAAAACRWVVCPILPRTTVERMMDEAFERGRASGRRPRLLRECADCATTEEAIVCLACAAARGAGRSADGRP